MLTQASLATAEGRRTDAVEAYTGALRLLEEQRLTLELSEARVAYGRALRRLGDAEGAAAELGRAREELVRMGARGLVDEIDRELGELTEGAGVAGPLTSP